MEVDPKSESYVTANTEPSTSGQKSESKPEAEKKPEVKVGCAFIHLVYNLCYVYMYVSHLA